MIKFNKEYVDNNTYPISIKQYLTNLCSQIGLELGSTKLVNENYQILGNPFTNHEDCKTVLNKVAELCGGFAKIGRDNKLYIINLNSNEYIKGLTVNEVHHMKVSEINSTLVKYFGKTQGVPSSATIDGNTYMKFKKNNMYGGVNSLVLRLSQVEGENDTETDEASIEANGLTEIVIEDNPFLINSEERKKVIRELWKALKGLKYLPFKLEEYYGFPYLDTGDKIEILDIEDTKYISFVFEHKFTYNGAFKGELNTEALTKTQTEYKNNNNMKSKFRRVELAVDKINGKITTVIEEQAEQETKINQTIQDVNGTTIEITNIKTDLQNNYDTSTEVTTKINAKAGELNVQLGKKVNNSDYTSAQILLKINNDTSTAKIKADKVSLEGKQINLTAENITFNSTKFSVDKNGKVVCSDITATGGTIGGFTLSANEFSSKITLPYTYTAADVERIRQIIMGNITPTANDYEKYDLSQSGEIDTLDWLTVSKIVKGQLSRNGYYKLNTLNAKKALQILDSSNKSRVSIGAFGSYFSSLTSDDFNAHSCSVKTSITANDDKIFIGASSYNNNDTSYISLENESGLPAITMYGYNGSIACASLTQTSMKSRKKNIKKFTGNALELIRDTDICLYNLKEEKTGSKKHIGLVIGEGYNCPDEVISEDRQGVEQYSMVSLAYKAIQELDTRLAIVEENNG